MRDIRAQVGALVDPIHPKDAVFIARGNAFVVERDEGLLITTNKAKADAYRAADPLTDSDLAAILGYPEAKADVMASGGGVVVQALDKDGNVVTEAAASLAGCVRTMQALKDHGRLQVVSPLDALARRVRES
jgi:hypothetical protein